MLMAMKMTKITIKNLQCESASTSGSEKNGSYDDVDDGDVGDDGDDDDDDNKDNQKPSV